MSYYYQDKEEKAIRDIREYIEVCKKIKRLREKSEELFKKMDSFWLRNRVGFNWKKHKPFKFLLKDWESASNEVDHEIAKRPQKKVEIWHKNKNYKNLVWDFAIIDYFLFGTISDLFGDNWEHPDNFYRNKFGEKKYQKMLDICN